MTATRRRPDAAGRAALNLYRTAPTAVRAHVAIRWWTAPFRAVVTALPSSGRIVEIGCGHGLFSAYAAIDSPERHLLGVDIDEEKIDHARRAATTVDNLDFHVAESGAVPDGPWDAAVFVDILYLLPAAEQRRLISEAVANLTPGGCVVIKEMGVSPRWKARWNTIQETLSVKVLHITEGSAFDFVPPGTTAGWLEDLGLVVERQRLDHGRAHPHHLLVGRAPRPSEG